MKVVKSGPAVDKNVEVSVVIPMYNSEDTIVQALRGLERQTHDRFEVVVVDDGSTDASVPAVEELSIASAIPIRLIRQNNAGPAEARNNGVKHSFGETIVFLDSDCIPAPNWVEEMVAPVNGKVAGCYCGNQVINGESATARYVQYEMSWRHQKMIGKSIDAFSTYSASMSKNAFEETGGFSTEYREASGEDFDLSFSLRRAGYDLRFNENTFVYQHHPDSLLAYLKKQYRRGYWRVKLYLRNFDKLVKGDSYTGREVQLQFILTSLAGLSIPLVFINPFIPLGGFGVLWLSNLPLGIWAAKREKRFLLLAPSIGVLRSLFGAAGVYKYVFEAAVGLVGKVARLANLLRNTKEERKESVGSVWNEQERS
jgi:glycosyltransferase involved in cell wall biosynthesis